MKRKVLFIFALLCAVAQGGVGTERDGRKFSVKPTAKGLYINNGKKVVIK